MPSLSYACVSRVGNSTTNRMGGYVWRGGTCLWDQAGHYDTEVMESLRNISDEIIGPGSSQIDICYIYVCL